MYKFVDSGLIAVLLQTDLQLAEVVGRTVIVERIFGWGSGGVFLFGGSFCLGGLTDLCVQYSPFWSFVSNLLQL